MSKNGEELRYFEEFDLYLCVNETLSENHCSWLEGTPCDIKGDDLRDNTQANVWCASGICVDVAGPNGVCGDPDQYNAKSVKPASECVENENFFDKTENLVLVGVLGVMFLMMMIMMVNKQGGSSGGKPSYEDLWRARKK